MSALGKFMSVNGPVYQKQITVEEEYALKLGLFLYEKFPGVAFLVQPLLQTVSGGGGKKEKTARLNLTILKDLGADKTSDVAQYCCSLELPIALDTCTVVGKNWRPIIEMHTYDDGKVVRCFASHSEVFRAASEPLSVPELQQFWCLGVLRAFLQQQKLRLSHENLFGISADLITDCYERMPEFYETIDSTEIVATILPTSVCNLFSNNSSFLRKSVQSIDDSYLLRWCAAQIYLTKKDAENVVISFEQSIAKIMEQRAIRIEQQQQKKDLLNYIVCFGEIAGDVLHNFADSDAKIFIKEWLESLNSLILRI